MAPAAKGEARRAVAAFVEANAAAKLWVRVNPVDSAEIDKDLAALVPARPDGIVLPKAEGGASVTELSRRLAERGNATAKIMAIATETPAAMFQLGSYGGVKRLAALTWGAEDLPAAIGASTSREADGRFTPPYELARSLCLFGAAAAGVLPIEVESRLLAAFGSSFDASSIGFIVPSSGPAATVGTTRPVDSSVDAAWPLPRTNQAPVRVATATKGTAMKGHAARRCGSPAIPFFDVRSTDIPRPTVVDACVAAGELAAIAARTAPVSTTAV